MITDSIEERRKSVNQLLRECMDEKVLRGGTDNAISTAVKAYNLAHLEPRLPSPWPELAAYRWSHLLLRYNSHDAGILEKINGLLEEAEKNSHLGPLPSIYRLAVLHRLQSVSHATKRSSELQREIERSIANAVDWLHRNSFAEQQTAKEAKAFQAATFNLLELAHYFLGAPYEKLEGLAGLDSLDPMCSGRWVLVGRDIARISMTEEMARCEFESRAARSKDVILITLDRQGARWGVSPSKLSELCVAKLEYAKLVLLSTDARIQSATELRRRVVGEDGEDPACRFRQEKKRTKEALQRFLGRSDIEIFDGHRLSEDLSILGLVYEPALR
jgi:hypothetical protein